MTKRCSISLCTALLILVLTVIAAFGADESLAVLRDVKAVGGGVPQVEITADRPLIFTAYPMPDLLKTFIDLPYTDPGTVAGVIPVNSGLIDKITVQKKLINGIPLTRIVISFHQSAEVSVAAGASGSARLTAAIRKAAPSAARPAPAVTPPPPAKPAATASAAPPPQPPRPAATGRHVISAINLTGTGLEIVADAPISEFRAFTLVKPERLVIDIPHAQSTLANVVLAANRWGIHFARTGVYPDKLRLVFEKAAAPFPSYRVDKMASGLSLVFTSQPPAR